MSYTRQTWQTGDTITAAKLNHMEDGIENSGGDVFVIPLTMIYDNQAENYTCTSTVTATEVIDAVTSNKAITVFGAETDGDIIYGTAFTDIKCDVNPNAGDGVSRVSLFGQTIGFFENTMEIGGLTIGEDTVTGLISGTYTLAELSFTMTPAT